MRNLGKVNLQKLINDLYIALEDNDTKKLNELCEGILKIDARNPHVYLCKAFSKRGLSKIEELNSEFLSYNLMVDDDYQHFLNCADDEFRAEVEEKLKCNVYKKAVEDFNNIISTGKTDKLNVIKKSRFLGQKSCSLEAFSNTVL